MILAPKDRELEFVQGDLERAKKSYRKLLPINSRKLNISDINTNNSVVFSANNADFEDFKTNWEDLINYLDKFWNKLNAYVKHHVAVDKKDSLLGYLGSVNKQRTSDELLRYIDKARNNAQHTLWRHLRESSPFEVIAGHGAEISFQPGQVTVTGPGDSAKEVNILLRPGAFMLNHVKVIENKEEVIYQLPIEHMNIPLTPMERVLPQITGKSGIMFYESVFAEFNKRLATQKT